jgi:hypothetical protein
MSYLPIQVMIPFLLISKSTETESRLVLAKGLGGGKGVSINNHKTFCSGNGNILRLV